MITIKDRAAIYERRCIDNAKAGGWGKFPMPSQSYITGAIEQQKIDIDKAKAAFASACSGLDVSPELSVAFDKFIEKLEE